MKKTALLTLSFFFAGEVTADDALSLTDYGYVSSGTQIYFSGSVNMSGCNVFADATQRKNGGRLYETNLYFYSCSANVADFAQLRFNWVKKDGVFRWISYDVRSKSLSYSIEVSAEDSCCISKVKSLKFFTDALSNQFSETEVKNTVGDLIVLYE